MSDWQIDIHRLKRWRKKSKDRDKRQFFFLRVIGKITDTASSVGGTSEKAKTNFSLCQLPVKFYLFELVSLLSQKQRGDVREHMTPLSTCQRQNTSSSSPSSFLPLRSRSGSSSFTALALNKPSTPPRTQPLSPHYLSFSPQSLLGLDLFHRPSPSHHTLTCQPPTPRAPRPSSLGIFACASDLVLGFAQVKEHVGLPHMLPSTKEAYSYGKRGLFIWQKKPIHMAKEAYS